MTATRRLLLQAAALLPFSKARADARALKRDYFKELGVRRFINAAEPFTALSGALMPPEVIEAWNYAAVENVRLDDLHDAVGKRIASLIGCEAAMVTAGAASALTLGTAACITGSNREFVRQLPDTRGMKTEVIIQKSHRYGYDHALRNCGIRFIEIETPDELEAAVNSRTAMMHFFNTNEPVGRIKGEEFVELGKKHGVPTFNDIAADVPPVDNLRRFSAMGFDLVTVSGGKGLCGPQNSGLLFGRQDLIRAARLNAPPNSDAIARGQKVNKEEILAALVTIELYLKRDHEADWREWEKRVNLIAAKVAAIPGVRAEMFVPEIHYRVPHLRIQWESDAVEVTVSEAIRRLREGEPSIEVRPSREALELGVWMLRRGEAEIVSRRIVEVLRHRG
jgi:L-seryl-tRNA(Ser) seleniumtransferase